MVSNVAGDWFVVGGVVCGSCVDTLSSLGSDMFAAVKSSWMYD